MKHSLRLPFTLALCCAVLIWCFQSKEKPNMESTATVEMESLKEEAEAPKTVSSGLKLLKKSILKIRDSLSPAQKQVEESSSTAITYTNNSFPETREPLSALETQSVGDITRSFSQAIAQKLTSHQFMQLMSDNLKLKSKFLDEGTSSIGSMVTVRTHDSLEGTRYIHTQFMGAKNNADFLQHASFQIRPSPESFAVAVKALDDVLPKNKVIKESSEDYILYSTGDGYVAWAKVANLEDLQSNDYNFASQKDVGTVIVTIEEDIHGMDEGHNH